jgi:succinate-acetate transporter protein
MNTNNEKMEKIVGLGKTRFIIQFGILGWGVSTAILFAGTMAYTKGSIGFRELVITFLLFPIGGIFWGAIMWEVFKRAAKSTPDGSK